MEPAEQALKSILVCRPRPSLFFFWNTPLPIGWAVTTLFWRGVFNRIPQQRLFYIYLRVHLLLCLVTSERDLQDGWSMRNYFLAATPSVDGDRRLDDI